MQIFQKSVILKNLNRLDNQLVEKAYQVFKQNYSQEKINKIKTLKEEEYQDGFLRDIFVDVLGYTIKPNDNYNLVRELKNSADSKKADGAIISSEQGVAEQRYSEQGGATHCLTETTYNTLAVIELKSTTTKDLTSVTQQAFNYKNNQPGCKYVITSNFHKLRFYIDYANEYEEFDLFNMTRADFDFMFLILSKESIFSNLPIILKQETKFHEQNISAQLYKDYSSFKYKIFENLIKNNSEIDKLTLFEKSQKLLDRILFIFFAEDSGLLPANSISRIIERYELLKTEDAYKSLYEIYKQYFGYMNFGRKGKVPADDIPAYNGGLFAPDEILDNVKIDDGVLLNDSLKLSKYDYSSEVDVNILGHIFEHSLSEIEEIEFQISAEYSFAEEHAPPQKNTPQKTPLQSNKRKKDGVFYTPKYITQYIVENTLGKLCENKRIELDIFEIEFDENYKTKNGLTEKGKLLYEKLHSYKEWLKTLKILDPACGSGAFLNQALNFLIAEHKKIDDVIAELTETPLRLFDTDKSILENNLYGVDINEESVEIAKLSLWLRTAQKGRKLSNLNNNIKCGNSLIDDFGIAGNKAFNWYKEFPQIFKEKDKKAWHITFALYNSRYSIDTDGLTRRFGGITANTTGFIARTFPEFTEEQEIIMAEELTKAAKKYNLNITALNICKDHLHAIIICEEEELSFLIGKWKGRSSYTFNQRINISDVANEHIKNYSDDKNGKLWAKGFNSVLIRDNEQYFKTLSYIHLNRNKHQLTPQTDGFTRRLEEMICSYEHAFRTEYSGGFDVVIGNPPYIKEDTNRQAFEGLHSHYCYQGKMDLWYFFGALALELVKKETGLIGYIAPNNWITNDGASKFRNIILKNGKIIEFNDFGNFKVFDSAGIQTMIYIMKRTDNNNLYNFQYSKIIDSKIDHETNQQFLLKTQDKRFTYFTTKIEKDKYIDKPINFINANTSIIIDNIAKKQNFSLLEEEILSGIDIPQDYLNKKNKDILGNDYNIGDGIFVISEQERRKMNLTEKENQLLKPYYTTSELEKYFGDKKNKYWIIYTNSSFKNSNSLDEYPIIKRHLDKYQTIITSENKPYGLNRARQDGISFLGKKIVSKRKCPKHPVFTYTEFDAYFNRTFMQIITNRICLKYLTGLLNSKLIAFWLKHKGKMQGDNYQIDKTPLLALPIFEPSEEKQNEIADLVTQIIDNKQKEIDYNDLLKQAKIENNFDREIILTKEIERFKNEIDNAENKIDRQIYELYELNENDISEIEQILHYGK